MRILFAGLALALFWGASRSEAQYAAGVYPARRVAVTLPYTTTPYQAGPIVSGSYVSGPSTIPSVVPLGRIEVPVVGGTYIPPYSYTVVPSPWPARHYSGYGGNDFPFYGRPYGRPYDAWTWPYLSGGYYHTLARYYYPPL